MIFVELERRNEKRMGTVIGYGSVVAVIFYVMVGFFGYATFLGPPESHELCAKNILQANYKNNTPMALGNFTLLFAVITAAPLVMLPAKDTIEELFYKEKGMSKMQNIMVTFLLICVNTILGLFISTIGDAMTLVGCTINPVIGFILPICFWWPYMKDQPWYSKDKLLSLITGGVIVICSVLSLVNFFQTVGKP
jgi:sodium-coupled neutral amino acid transporter 11